MNSDCDRATSFIDSLDKEAMVAFLARLIYELTIAGRACYSTDSPGLVHPNWLRSINELQHALASQIVNTMLARPYVRSSRDLVALFLEPNEREEELYREVRRSFIDAISASLKQ
jgi:hypothetical protein